jgi:PEGA domain
MMGGLAAAAALLVLAGATGAAPATPTERPENIAVLIVGATADDAELADNLTEVVIARVAQRKNVQIVGTVEFRRRLGLESEDRARLCLEDGACVGTTAVSLGVTRILSGTIGRRGTQYLFALALRSMSTGAIEKRVFRLIDGALPDLIATVQREADDIFVRTPEPARLRVESDPADARVSIDDAFVGRTPVISGDLVSGSHRVRVDKDGRFPWASTVDVPAGSNLVINLSPANLPRRLAWPTYAVYATAAGAVVLTGVGAMLGTSAEVDPSLANRKEAQQDFERRRQVGLAADVTFVGAAVVAIVSAVLLYVYRDHIFGR